MSFEVQDCAANSVRLQTAILLYGSDHGNLSYATIHPVDLPSPDASPVIRAGRPADSTSLKEVCASLMSSARIRTRRPSSRPAGGRWKGQARCPWWCGFFQGDKGGAGQGRAQPPGYPDPRL